VKAINVSGQYSTTFHIARQSFALDDHTSNYKVCMCMCVQVRAYVSVCVRACARVCVCVHRYACGPPDLHTPHHRSP
jgi:hypothetical protein